MTKQDEIEFAKALLNNPMALTVSVSQAALILGIAKSTAHKECRSGFLTEGVPVIQIGRRRLISITHLRVKLGLPAISAFVA